MTTRIARAAGSAHINPAVEVVQPGMPAVVIGIGDFGRQLWEALSLVRQRRPSLSRLVGLWASPAGWHIAGDEQAETRSEATLYTGVAEWLEMHAASGHKLLQESVLQALSMPDTTIPGESRPETLNIYLVAHLNEPLGRALWHPVLALARAARVPFADHVFTLILATDSLTFSHLTPIEAQALLTTLDLLSVELTAAADESETPGRIGWCYLLDTVDLHGRPLPAADEALVNSLPPSAQQVHHTAEFIALLSSGLCRAPSYQRTSLAHLKRDFRDRGAAARVSVFGAASALFPIAAMTARANQELAHRLLADFILGADKPGDLPVAWQSRTRWLSDCAIEPGSLRQQIMHGAQGHPITFPIEPPQVEEVDDERLVDHLLNWDTILWQRWHRADGPPARLSQNSMTLIQKAVDWLRLELDGLLQSKLGGVRLATLLIAEVEKAVEEAHTQGAVEPPLEDHWLTRLLAILYLRQRDPTELPDLEISRHRLEKALLGRLNRRAIWVRAGLFGATLLSFVWAAYLAAGQALGLPGLASRWLNISPEWGVDPLTAVDLLVLAASCWLLALFVSALHLYWRESVIHRATEQMMVDIGRKYRALMERALRQERDNIYATLLAEVHHWRQLITARSDTLRETQQELKALLADKPNPAPLVTERCLLPCDQWANWLPSYEPPEYRRLAERFLLSQRSSAWPEQTSVQLLSALQIFAEAETSEWRGELPLNLPAVRDKGSAGAKAILQELRATVRPLWPLSREERAHLLTGIERPLGPERQRHGAATIVTHWLGVPTPATRHDAVMAAGPRDIYFNTTDSGRMAFVSTLHGLELGGLQIWEVLRVTAGIVDVVMPVASQGPHISDGAGNGPAAVRDKRYSEFFLEKE
jgi:hypothetical protein